MSIKRIVEVASVKKLFGTVISIGLFFLFICVALWLIYPMSEMVVSGTYTHRDAIFMAARMAFVTTGLSLCGIAIAVLMLSSASNRKVAFRNALVTGVALAAYTALNVMWREQWQPGSNSPAFLPPWSDLNAHFFYEYNWLSYLLFLTPLAMVAAGALSLLFTKLFFGGASRTV
jgi:hypothetical protein